MFRSWKIPIFDRFGNKVGDYYTNSKTVDMNEDRGFRGDVFEENGTLLGSVGDGKFYPPETGSSTSSSSSSDGAGAALIFIVLMAVVAGPVYVSMQFCNALLSRKWIEAFRKAILMAVILFIAYHVPAPWYYEGFYPPSAYYPIMLFAFAVGISWTVTSAVHEKMGNSCLAQLASFLLFLVVLAGSFLGLLYFLQVPITARYDMYAYVRWRMLVKTVLHLPLNLGSFLLEVIRQLWNL